MSRSLPWTWRSTPIGKQCIMFSKALSTVFVSASNLLADSKRNKPSAFQNPHIIDEYLANEVARSRVAGPFTSIPLPNLHVSSFGVTPKKVNLLSGALLWIYHPPRGLVSMMVSIPMSFLCITLNPTRLSAWF